MQQIREHALAFLATLQVLAQVSLFSKVIEHRKHNNNLCQEATDHKEHKPALTFEHLPAGFVHRFKNQFFLHGRLLLEGV